MRERMKEKKVMRRKKRRAREEKDGDAGMEEG